MRSFSTFRRRLNLAAASVLTLAVSAGRASALDGDRLITQYVIERWGNERGYPGGAIHGMAQSPDGDLWLATEKGLVRFDGLTFTAVTPTQATGARHAALGLASDPADGIWARLQGPQLVRVRGGTLDPVPLPGRFGGVVTSLYRAADGSLLLAPLGDGVLQYRDGQARTRVPLARMPGSFVIAIAESRDGTLWLGTRDSGLLRVEGTAVTALVDGLPDRKVNALTVDGRDRVWIATDRGVARWANGVIAAQPLPVPGETGALAIARDRHDNVWAALGSQGLARITASGRAAVLPWDASRQGEATALLEDRDGNLWVGTSRGLECVRDGAFATFTTAHGLPADGVGPVAVDGEGRVWMAPARGGLFWYADGAAHQVAGGSLDGDVVYSIAAAPDGVWVGRQRGGLSHVRIRGGASIVDRITTREGLAQDSVYAVHRARDGSVWAGTLSAGVSRLRDGVVTTFTRAEGLASNTVTSIADSADGGVWLGTPAGVSVREGDSWRRLDRRNGLPSNDVISLLGQRDGTMWIGTSSGLAFVREGVVRSLTSVPLLAASILALGDDAAGHVWIATPDAVLRAPASRLLAVDVGDADLQRFDQRDGLASTEGVRRHRTIVADGQRRVWLSLARGLSRADVDGLDWLGAGPRHARLDSVLADDVTLAGPAPRLAPPRTRRLTLTFDDDGLTLPERTRFRYRLDGFDAGWSAPTASRTVAYTNLSPRTYAFRVVALDRRGLPGPEEVVAIRIGAAFWQTTWFAGAAAVALIGLGWAGYRWRLRHVARQMTWAFEERLAERTRVAQDLHDTLLQGCLAASMQLHLAVDRLPDDAPARPGVDRVLQLLTRVVDEGRAAVRGLRADVADDLERALARVPAELAPNSAAVVRVIVEGQPRPWHPVVRDEVYRIGREALANALRHAGAAHIDLCVSYGARAVRVSVRDDGRGMDEATRRHGRDDHWGLAGMQERAESIGGTVRVLSREGAGTEVELVVPASAALVTSGAGVGRRWWSRRGRVPRTTASSETES